MSEILGIKNQFKNSKPAKELETFTKEKLGEVIKFHTTMPGYEKTPLNSLGNLSKYLGVDSIYVKDESYRFGLNAFKGLGVSYAVADYFAKKLSLNLSEIDFKTLLEKSKSLPPVIFATATDGNHGKGLAWAAQLFEQTAKVYMPKGASPARLEAIRSFGAEAYETDMNYDDTVKMVSDLAEEKGWVVIQDTGWEGYEEVPLAIMQGYTSMVSEITHQLGDINLADITHVFLQAGVGSFASSIATSIAVMTEGKTPTISIVEPREAHCLFQSAKDHSGKPKRVYGDLETIMAGLACGDPNPIAWNILKTLADYYYSCEDIISAKGMRVLGNPLGDDPRIIAGESGSVPLGFVYEIMSKDQYSDVKKELGLDENAKILVINTEGDTNPENYRKAVWE